MSSIVMPALLVVANVLGAGMIVPQVLRFRRHRSVDGVSGAWVGVGIAVNAWWLVYAVAGGLWGLVPVSGVALVLYLVIACQYVAIVGSGGIRQVAIGVIATGSVPLPFLLLGGWPAAGLAIGLIYGVQFSPAAVTAVRSLDLSGVSSLTWVMACIEAAIWLVYGIVEADVALIVGGTGGTLLSAVVLVCLARGSTSTLHAALRSRPPDSNAALGCPERHGWRPGQPRTVRVALAGRDGPRRRRWRTPGRRWS